MHVLVLVITCSMSEVSMHHVYSEQHTQHQYSSSSRSRAGDQAVQQVWTGLQAILEGQKGRRTTHIYMMYARAVARRSARACRTATHICVACIYMLGGALLLGPSPYPVAVLLTLMMAP